MSQSWAGRTSSWSHNSFTTFYQLSLCSLKTKGPLTCVTAFSSRQYGTADLVHMCAGQGKGQRWSRAKVPVAHLCTSSHSWQDHAIKLEHLHSSSIRLFAAAKDTQHTAPSQSEHDHHPILTRRLLDLWTRDIFPTHPCLGSHSPFIDPSMNHQGPPPATQSLHSAGVVETQSAQSLVQDFISPLKLERLWHEQCNQMWPGSEILTYPSTSLFNVMTGLIPEQTCKALVSLA